jgi:Type II intron maturase
VHAGSTTLRTQRPTGPWPGLAAVAIALRQKSCASSSAGSPSWTPQDPGYRRLRYLRYADDTLLGFAGPKADAEEIKRRLAEFLHDELELELSGEKTLITHARTERARFLGYEVTTKHADRSITRGRRTVNGTIGLYVPKTVIRAKCAEYMERGKPARLPQRSNWDDHGIVASYGAECRGVVQYYLLAGDVSRLGRLHWVMLSSMLKTLAGKHSSSVSKMARKHMATVETPYGPHRCFQASVERGGGRKPLVARFGGIPLRREKGAVLVDSVPVLVPPRRKELVSRLLAGRCEMCGRTEGVQVHQLRKLADLARPGQQLNPAWVSIMVSRRRKTLVVCGACHASIHLGTPALSFKK